MKKIIILISLLFLNLKFGDTISSYLFARDAIFEGEEYSIKAIYNDRAYPGDAVFVRITFERPNPKGKNKNTIDNFNKLNVTLSLYAEGKKCRESDFFVLSKKEKNKTLLAGLPLSSWWTPETKLSLKITYTLDGKKKMEVDLPFKLDHKTFVFERIDLNDKNTSIKSNTSPKRTNEIQKLSTVLGKVNKTSIYQTSSFIPPTKETRRTSFFADRREYKYTSGKSSTELHLGIDYGVPEGSPVLSCANGKVVIAEMRVSTGWSVVVEHLPGLYSLYYHMSRINVKEGEMVKAGQPVGLSGSTGLATGPHLHWEIRLNSEAVNPDFFTEDFTFENNK